MSKKVLFKTPILFLIFNRPDTTKRVFAKIKKVRPKFLYIAADGPRNKDEMILTEKVRKLVIKSIDWDCQVKTLFRENNLGCGKAVSSAIDWFFKNEEMGIILEDDCLPDLSFFYFCEEMLKKYKSNPKIMHISGDNYLPDFSLTIDESYFFSKYIHIWGGLHGEEHGISMIFHYIKFLLNSIKLNLILFLKSYFLLIYFII